MIKRCHQGAIHWAAGATGASEGGAGIGENPSTGGATPINCGSFSFCIKVWERYCAGHHLIMKGLDSHKEMLWET